jgi:hypothetical protein
MSDSHVRQQSVRQTGYVGKSGLMGWHEFGLFVVTFKGRK